MKLIYIVHEGMGIRYVGADRESVVNFLRFTRFDVEPFVQVWDIGEDNTAPKGTYFPEPVESYRAPGDMP